MTGKEIELVTALVKLLSGLGGSGLMWVMGMAVFGVPVVMIVLFFVNARIIDRIMRRYGEDMTEMRSMYRANASLVKRFEELATQASKLTEQHAETIHLNTQILTTLAERIANNLFCPMVRKEGKAP